MVKRMVKPHSSARSVGYRRETSRASSYASATMHYTGPMLLLYIVFHIAHFTAPGLSLGGHEFSQLDVYGNFVASFQLPWVTLLYVTANLLLGMHLYHGAYSLLQSLGLNHPRYNLRAKQGARAFAFAVTAGNVIMPLSVLFGIIH